MKLSYRGSGYDYDSSVPEMIESGTIGKYRGVTYTSRHLKEVLVPRSALVLQYRGDKYLSGVYF